MHVFYAPEFPEKRELPEEESKHAIRVLRLSPGDPVMVSDGRGNLYRAEIGEIGKKSCRLLAEQLLDPVPATRASLHIAMAPPKNMKRFEWFLEKACEIGVDEITPLITERSERRKINRERAEKVLIGAMKQSLKSRLPLLHETRRLDEWLDDLPEDGKLRFIAHLSKEALPLAQCYRAGAAASILIGPEGDFSENERAKAAGKAFVQISLGPHRLRTETAGLVACTTVQVINEMHP